MKHSVKIRDGEYLPLGLRARELVDFLHVAEKSVRGDSTKALEAYEDVNGTINVYVNVGESIVNVKEAVLRDQERLHIREMDGGYREVWRRGDDALHWVRRELEQRPL